MDNNKQKTPGSAPKQSPPKPEWIPPKKSDHSLTPTKNDGEAIKRLPPIKAPVGLAKSPDLKNCKSKIGSLNNIKHTPAGGKVTIENRKLQWNAKSKVGSLENKEHKPAGGNVKVETRKLEWKTGSKVQSLQYVNHKPGGGNVKIFNESYRDKSIIKRPVVSNNNGSSTATTNSTVNSLSKDLKDLNLAR